MPLNQIPIPSFIGGISKQPETLVVQGQTRTSTNMFLDLENGASRRNGTVPVSNTALDLTLAADYYTHWIDRDASRRYLVVVCPDAALDADLVTVIDVLTGVRQVVNPVVNGYTEDPLDYIRVTGVIKMVTVGDTTLICNTAVTPSSSTGDAATYTHTTTCNIDSISGGTVVLSQVGQMLLKPGDTFTFSNSVGTTRTVTHATSADTSTDTLTVKFTPTSSLPTAGTHTASMVDTNITSASSYRFRNSYLDFPSTPTANDQIWYADTDSIGRPAGFYKTINTGSTGPKYERVHAPEAGWRLTGDTMPVSLKYNAGTDEFDLECIDWAERLSGDTVTNPAPPFVGTPLSGMTFHQDRFWVFWNDRIMGSVSNDYWNFWLDNWRSVGDSDPIEVGTSGTSVSYIKHAIPLNNSLVLFCTGGTQFEIRSANDGQLTPSSVSVLPSTSVNVDHDCTPAKLNNNLYFMSSTAPVKMTEYFYSFDAYSNIAVDVSLHCKGLLPSNPVEISTTDMTNTVVSLFDSERTALYAHYVTWGGTEKLQSAWCKWTFADDILSFHIYDNWVYILFQRGNTQWLDKMYLGTASPDAGVPMSIKLDRRFVVTGSYNSTTRTTTFTLPYLDASITKVILTEDHGAKAGFERVVTQSTVGGVTVLSCSGDYSGDVWVGIPYTSEMELVRPFARDSNGRVVLGSMHLNTLGVHFKDTSYFEVAVTPYRRETKTHVFNPVRVGSALINELVVEEAGVFNMKPLVAAEKSTVTVQSSSHLPFTLTGGTWGVRFIPSKQDPTK